MAGRYSLDAIFRAIDRVTRPIDKMQQRMRRFTDSAEKGLKSIDRVTGATIKGFGKLATAMTVAGTAAAAGLAVAAKPGIDFEQQIADLGATMLKTREQIAPLEQEALRLGAATKFSATDVAGAMAEMSKSGYEATDILAGVEGMTYAAAAAGEDLIATTSGVTSVMKGMGLATKETARVSDVLSKASVETSASMASLQESMSKAGPIARQFNFGLEETVAMASLLEDAGADASEAGNSIATMLTRLAGPSDAMRAQMRALGVSFQDAAGNMKSPADVLEQLGKLSAKAGGNMKAAALMADLVGLRGQRAALNLKEFFKSGKYGELVDSLKNARGTAEKMAKLRMNTFAGDLDVFVENLKAFSIQLWALASGPLREVLRGITAWVDKNRELIVSGVVDFVKSIANNMPTIALWAERIGKAAAVWFSWALGVKAATAAMTALNAVMAMTPIGLISTAIVAAAALIVAFWPEISAFFSKVWAGITDLAARVWAAASGLAGAILGSLRSVLSAVGSVISGAVAAVAAGLATVWSPVRDLLVGAAEFLVGLVALIAAPIVFIVGAVVSKIVKDFVWLGGQIKALWMPVQALLVAGVVWVAHKVAAICEVIGAAFAALWDGVKYAAQLAFDGIVAVATVVVGALRAIWEPLAVFFTLLWEGIAGVAIAVWDRVKAVVSGVFDWMVGKLTYVLELVSGAVSSVREVGREALGTVGLGGGESPQVVSPHERAAAAEGAEAPPFGSAELTIKGAPAGSQITKRPQRGGWFDVALAPSGKF